MQVSVTFQRVEGTGAALGWAGSRTVVADRPAGRAGGTGLGFNGAELIALAIGGCFCNDLNYCADTLGMEITGLEVGVAVELDGTPLLVTSATIRANVEVARGATDAERLIARAAEESTISNSIIRGFPVRVECA